MTSRGSLKVKVGLYAALITIIALITGAAVVIPTVYYHQISQLDEVLKSDAEELVRDLQNFRGAPTDPRRPLSQKFIPLSLRGRYLSIEGPEGQIVYQSANLRGTNLEGKTDGSETRELFDRNCRITTTHQGPYLIHIGTRLGTIERFQSDLLRGFIFSIPFVALVVFLGGLWLGRRAIAPVAMITAAAERISAHSPSDRLPMPRAKDEIARLTSVLNQTFDRLQSSYQSATRFSADASHQLKTPITILRNGLDTLASSPGLDPDHLASIKALRQQTRRLTALIEDLLLLAQADAGRLQIESEATDLQALLAGSRDDLEVLTAGREITIESDLPGSLPALVDPRRIKLILQNLIENAAKYTPDGGTIRILATTDETTSRVIIENSGTLVPEHDREKIFERFRRGDSVGENIRGQGLGLNIARELARAHGGEIHYEASDFNRFVLRLPRARKASE